MSIEGFECCVRSFRGLSLGLRIQGPAIVVECAGIRVKGIFLFTYRV